MNKIDKFLELTKASKPDYYNRVRMELLIDDKLKEFVEELEPMEIVEALMQTDYDRFIHYIMAGSVNRIIKRKMKDLEDKLRKDLINTLYGGK